MNVPGLQYSDTNEDGEIKTYDLDKETEWRFEVPFKTTVELKLLQGRAEIFGTEIAPGQKYTFTGTKLAVFTWHGCRIEVSGHPSVEYVSDETPMTAHANAHFALQKMRGEALERGSTGPRVLIVGPEDAGKTTLVKLLTSYAQKMGEKPVVINVNPKEGLMSIPGTLTATSFSTILDVEEHFGSSPTSGPSTVPVKLPLVYYYGLETPDKNPRLYKKLVSRLALAVSSRLSEDKQARASGCIIDTPSYISTTAGADMIQHIVAEFSVNVIITLGSERLYSDLHRRFEDRRGGSESVTVIKLPKSGGCVDRDDAYVMEARQRAVREYFFGEPKRTLSPYTMSVDYSSLVIYEVAKPNDLSHFLPAGTEPEAQPLLDRVEPSPALLNSVAALVNADLNASIDDLVESSVMGFVFIAEVDEAKKKLKILAPVTGRLPPKPLVISQFPEVVLNLVG